jgi:hypothetical protein
MVAGCLACPPGPWGSGTRDNESRSIVVTRPLVNLVR